MDYQKIAEIIERAVEDKIHKKAPHIRLGTVDSVTTTSISVRIDGSSSPAAITKACTCSPGDRVVILKEGTQFYAIGRIGG